MFLLLLPAWFAAFLAFRAGRSDALDDWRDAALAASVVWGVLVVALTEALSLFHALSFIPLALAWGLISAASVAVCMCLWSRGLLPKEVLANLLGDGVSRLLVAGTSLILLATLVVVLVAPPNNWDSMTYHMARVANWVDHRSVRDYPTHIIRQLYLGPWAEFVITHLQVLTGGDRFANCVQYLAMLGSLLGCSLVAKKLGASARGQLFASVFCATIPMGVLQASSTQTDYVAAFWFLAFLSFLLGLVSGPGEFPHAGTRAVLAGAGLGLALLTKMTVLLMAAPFLLWFGLTLVSKRRARAVLSLAIVAFLALAVNAGHILRNQRAFGWPLGPRAEAAMYANEIHTPAALASNVIRNIAVHLGTPLGVNGILGQGIYAAVMRIHGWTGMDLNDRRTTFLDTQFEYSLSLNEDYAGNPLHLILAAGALLAAVWGFRQNRMAAVYSACLIGAFLVFCGYLKWQPWISRLHLPLFVAAAPVFGILATRNELRRVAPLITVLLLFVGTIYATEGQVRPLIGKATILRQTRTDLYFTARASLRGPFLAAAAELARGEPSTVGIVSGLDDWEYPLRVLVRMRTANAVQFEHISVENPSRSCVPDIPGNQTPPDKIVLIGTFEPARVPAGYRPAFAADGIHVFERATTLLSINNP